MTLTGTLPRQEPAWGPQPVHRVLTLLSLVVNVLAFAPFVAGVHRRATWIAVLGMVALFATITLVATAVMLAVARR